MVESAKFSKTFFSVPRCHRIMVAWDFPPDSFSTKAKAWIRMMRLHTSLIYPSMGLAASLFILRRPRDIGFLVPVLSILLISISAYMLNDVFDVDVDEVSNADRPIPTGVLSKREVSLVGSLCLAGGFLLATTSGSIIAVGISVIMCALSVFYSAPPIRLRRLFIAPYLVIAGFASLSFLFAAAYHGSLLEGDVLLGGILVLGYATGSCTVKEFKDLEGDSSSGVKSIPSTLGLERGVKVTLPLYLGAYMLLLPLFWIFSLHEFFLVAFVAIFAIKVKKSYDLLQAPREMERRIGILKVEVVSTVIIFLLAALSATIG